MSEFFFERMRRELFILFVEARNEKAQHELDEEVERITGKECDDAARSLSKEEFKREVEKELTGRETEAWEIIYFKLYQSQTPVIEKAIETAALMLGTDKSRGYCLEMICADFLAGANLDNENPETLLFSMTRFFKFLPQPQQQVFLQQVLPEAA